MLRCVPSVFVITICAIGKRFRYWYLCYWWLRESFQ